MSVGEDVEKLAHLCPVARNVKWLSCYEKHGAFSKKLKENCHMIKQSHFSLFTQKVEIRILKRYLHNLNSH